MPETSRFYVEIGRKVRSRRDELKLSQEDLAKHLGLTRSSVANLEAGQQRILAETLMLLASALSLDPAELLPARVPAISVDNLMPGSVPVNVQRWIKTVLDKVPAAEAFAPPT